MNLIKTISIILLFSFQTFASPKACETVFEKGAKSNFQQDGMTGNYVNTTDPFGLLPENKFKVAIVESLPNKPVKKSKIEWLKDSPSLSLIQTMLDHGAPVVYGVIPPGTSADAFVLPPSYQMTGEILKAKKDDRHKNILFLQASATKDVISHELQHWKDYEEGVIDAFIQKLEITSKKLKLTNGEFVIVQNALVEQRGHARQEIVLREDKKGKVATNYVESIYRPYVEKLNSVFLKLDKKSKVQSGELLNLLVQFELKNPGHISFTHYFSDRLK